jgi:hypothetical protein
MNKLKAEVIFFPNGNTAVFIDGEQSSKHQRSWFLKYVSFLTKGNIDVLNSKYTLPDGRRAELIKLKRGYNWKIL